LLAVRSFDKDLLTLVERIDKTILEQLLASLDAWAVLSLPLASNPLFALDSKMFFLLFFVFDVVCGLNQPFFHFCLLWQPTLRRKGDV